MGSGNNHLKFLDQGVSGIFTAFFHYFRWFLSHPANGQMVDRVFVKEGRAC